MRASIDQSVLRDCLKNTAKINSIDKRGYYIAEGGINAGIHYLYDDGIIRCGVKDAGEATAFWSTETEAITFFEAWKRKLNR